MYEDRTIEEKYLHNFSPKERDLFYKEQRKKLSDLAKYEGKLNELIISDSPAIFANYIPDTLSSALEIKYVLNRIAANDSRDIAFELGKIDGVRNADQWAPYIVQAFQNNFYCKKIILNNIGLSEEGLSLILGGLQHKSLRVLDIEGNKTTNKIYELLDEILSNPENKWRKVNLGRVILDENSAKKLNRHSNLSFSPIIRISSHKKGIFDLFTPKKEYLK